MERGGGRSSALKGLADFLSPAGGFGGLSPRLPGVCPLPPGAEEARVGRGGGEGAPGAGPRSGGVVRGGPGGEKASVGSHAVWGPPVEDAIKEVL